MKRQHSNTWAMLAAYVADAELNQAEYGFLRKHLERCLECQDMVRRLRFVEAALRSKPAQEPAPELTWRILRDIAAERHTREEWKLIPWTVWLPVLTLLLAVSIVALVLPPSVQITLPALASPVAPMPMSLEIGQGGPWLFLDMHQGSLWPIWLALLVLLSGCGLALSVSSWSTATNRQFDRLEDRVSSAAQRILETVPWER